MLSPYNNFILRAQLFLDLAPLVAIVWLRLLAIAFNVEHVSAIELALGLCVWLIYTTDHYLDFLSGRRKKCEIKDRRMSTIVWTTLTTLFVLDLFLAWTCINPAVMIAITPLFLCVTFYFGMIHTTTIKAMGQWPREIIVGILFTLGFCVPIAALISHWGRLLMLYPFLALLAILNCCGVKRWASPSPESRHKTTQWIGEHLHSLGFGLAIAASLLRIAIGGPVLLAVIVSASALALLPTLGKKWRKNTWYMAADIALCSPLLLPVFWK